MSLSADCAFLDVGLLRLGLLAQQMLRFALHIAACLDLLAPETVLAELVVVVVAVAAVPAIVGEVDERLPLADRLR